jgi:hypothetical protein
VNRNLLKNILTEELLGTRSCESIEDYEIIEYMFEALMLEKFLFGEPISVPELRKLLRKRIVNFEFIKLDGHVRPARGTTNLKYIPAEDHPKGIRPASDNVATFFDLDKDAWRSVSKKSKEIVLKKDEEKDRPIVVVRDKDSEIRKYGKDPERLGPEPEDDLHVGDIRNYLNRNGKNILIKITRMEDDGSVFAQTVKEKTPFKVPANRIQNIGEIADIPIEEPKPSSYVAPRAIGNIPVASKEDEEPPEMKPVSPNTPEGGGVIEIELEPVVSPDIEEAPLDDPDEPEELDQEDPEDEKL